MTEPTLTRQVDGLTFAWPSLHLDIQLSRIRESSGETKAELTARVQNGTKTGVLTMQSVNLHAGQSRDRLAKTLHKRYPLQAVSWDTILETVCFRGLMELRRSEPTQWLDPTSQAVNPSAFFVLNPLLYHLQPTLLYGPGESGKSLFALYCAMLLAAGVSASGLVCSPEPRKVLYLDWEFSFDVMLDRTRMLFRGDERLRYPPAYRRVSRPLVEFAEDLMKEMEREGFDVLVVDSVAPAATGRDSIKDAEGPLRFFEALRALNVTSLLVGHVAKTSSDEQKDRQSSPYGSVFFYNMARNVFEVKKTQETDETISRLGLFHTKCNMGRRIKPLGFELMIDEHAARATVSSYDLNADAELSQKMPLADRIEGLLKDHQPRSSELIADLLNVPVKLVRNKLSYFKGKRWQCSGGRFETESEWFMT